MPWRLAGCGRTARAGAPACRGANRRQRRRTTPRPAEQGHASPRALVEQQVVAFGDDEPGLGVHGNGPRDGLFDLAAEFGCVHRLIAALAAQPLQQCGVAGAVEGVGRAFAAGAAQPLQLHVGQVKAIHRHHLRHVGQRLLQCLRQGRFAGARRADQAPAACGHRRRAACVRAPGTRGEGRVWERWPWQGLFRKCSACCRPLA